jgi:hypothetical protein
MSYSPGLPTNNWISTTPHDTNYVVAETTAFDYIRVGTAGGLAVTQFGGTEVVFDNVLAGETIGVVGVRVKATGTTATTVQCAFLPTNVDVTG